jgi:hypothetical protein
VNLALLPDRVAVCRLAPDSEMPRSAVGGFWSVTRTSEELSVVCAEASVPEGVRCEAGWRILKVAGPLEFSLTGILLAVATPLAETGVSIFVISTFDTDYVLVKEENVDRAVTALEAAGHGVARRGGED